jgi:hypothetical protein
MKKITVFLSIILLLTSCKSKQISIKQNKEISLTTKQIKQLIKLPLHCVNKEYPNKLSQVLERKSDLKSPKELHPAFYGCFDWHSSVHGHWSLVKLLKENPKIKEYNQIIQLLKKDISKKNILQEVAYFDRKYNKNYERTYGWAWLLKLADELHTWNNKDAKQLEKNLQPLTDLIIKKYIEFLPKLRYPIRAGTHTNTAFGLVFAYDYTKTINHTELQNAIIERAKFFYLNDKNCPISWEPSGTDFLSPCLEEAALMKRILNKKEYLKWLNQFLPELLKKDYNLQVGVVTDRTDGHLVHLDGLNFSRAWCLNEISKNVPQLKHLKKIAAEHIKYSLPNLTGDSYEGGHWLASFAIYALDTQY